MCLRWRVLAAASALLFTPWLWSQSDVQFFPLSEIRPGLKGVGRTVFEGDRIEEFQVEILDVLKNATSPKHDIILARLSGGPLEKTGVIAGMSGSPVYVDGKLVGAVALSFPFSKEPLAGITPIQEMLQVVPERPSKATPPVMKMNFRIAKGYGPSANGGRLIPDEETPLSDWKRPLPSGAGAASLAGLRLPLLFGGFASDAVQAYASLFREMGFEPVQGGVLAGGGSDSKGATELAPGSMVSLLLVRGDLNVNVDCTVTFRQGDNLYACGHRVLLSGPAQIPFAPSRVLVTVPSLASSFKVNAPGAPVGSIQQDRFGAVYGVIGEKAPLIPVHVQVDSTLNKKTDYRFEMLQEPFLSPALLNLAVVSTLSATERMVGPSTLELKGKILLSNGESVDLEDVVSADINTANMAGLTVSAPLTYLLASGFPDLRVEGIHLAIAARNERRAANLEQVWSTKSEVRPGEHIEVVAVLRTPTGESVIEKIPVDIPESISNKTLSLVVASGSVLNALQSQLMPLSTPLRDLRQLVRALNRMRRNNRLYALLMAPQRSFVVQGDEYPSPPPSLVQTILADPSVSSSVIISGTSIVGDFEAKPSPYVIRGQKTLVLTVAGMGG